MDQPIFTIESLINNRFGEIVRICKQREIQYILDDDTICIHFEYTKLLMMKLLPSGKWLIKSIDAYANIKHYDLLRIYFSISTVDSEKYIYELSKLLRAKNIGFRIHSLYFNYLCVGS